MNYEPYAICIFCKKIFRKHEMESWQENDDKPVEYLCKECWKKEIKK